MKNRSISIAAALGVALTSTAASAAVIQGPSSSQTPYLTPTFRGWSSYSILTVGDSVGGYAMAGIPDGLGAFDNNDGTITILMNHELPGAAGGPRSHGAPSGAFVSEWVVQKNNLAVVSGRDLATSFENVTLTNILNRLCSADLPALSAFYNASTGLGYNGRIFMNGEEAGPTGRAIGWVVSERKAYELPALSTFSWENSVANPGTGDRTLVAGTEDAGGGRIHMYLGAKQAAGSAVEQAGLTNGQDFVLRLTDGAGNPVVGNEDRVAGLPGAGAIDTGALVAQSSRFALLTGGAAAAANGTGFSRPEDFSWDPNDPNVGYFVTTDQYDQVKDGVGTQVGRSRLWRIRFDDVNAADPVGTIEMLIDGTEATQMMDNITVGEDGRVYIQEDVGNQQHLGKIWAYDPATGALEQIFQHDQARFGNIGVPPMSPFTIDEESSGITEVTSLFRGSDLDFGGRNRFFLADVQAHYPLGSPLVEGGQLLLLVQAPEPGMFALFGLGVAGAIAMRRRRS